MNLEYRPGSVVVWVDVLDFREPRNGDHVIVYSVARDERIEATIKEYRLQNGHEWLWPRSDDPAHQTPIDPANPPEGIHEVLIKGIVIGDYRQRVA
jgi:hypothetical protein